ncbi:3-hydroxyacyl-CoA dehydrogenase NAD-binding domain-containing protein [Protofrankia symbiont of Coriaria ruscifolia]|uniref:3-hydroxyacyl-CoA dehydrogenase NAD-binding domain-containing protein n=1 Tax=Protofrankia symbiont of Coriaria ruscifolia TaxID=1306542 RepID=UPI001A93CCFB|nr:3-hydroxyacyl-CoA dehydrogenase NAD-binding domain-containing protein [Protofrankia symbiont of Coriaria ruscifolia]
MTAVGVIGAGTMGVGIAYVFAAADCEVFVVEPDPGRARGCVEASAASGALTEAGLGHVAGDVVWLSVEGLRAAVLSALEASSAERTAASFDGMVSYARSRGWVSLDGERLQAHFVYA